MSTYSIHFQRIRGQKFRVVLVGSNGKLVLCGETLKNSADARNLQESIRYGNIAIGEDLDPYHKFTKNSGPAKKKAVKLAFRVDNPKGYSSVSVVRRRVVMQGIGSYSLPATGKTKKKATKKK